MKLFLRAVPGVLLFSAVIAAACFSTKSGAQAPDSAPAQAVPNISQFMGNLADQPPTHLGFVFDRSMLQAARNLLQSGGMTPERAAAALTGISYDNYRYAHPAVYAPETMQSITEAYHLAHWKHLVNAHEPAPGETQHKTATDLWLHYTGSDIDGVTVLTRGSKDVNVVQVACDLRPLDLVHLSGHFGIPKVDPGAVMVPAPDGH
jgi:hypothetical protein